MISAIFLATARGDILFHRSYIGEITVQDAAEFVHDSILFGIHKHGPIAKYRRCVYAKVAFNSLNLYCAVRRNGNVLAALTCLLELKKLISTVAGDTINSDSILNNILAIYEILDEVIDGGCVQNMERVALANFSISESSARLLLKNPYFVQYTPSEITFSMPLEIADLSTELPTIEPLKQPVDSLFKQKEDMYESFNATYMAATSVAIMKGVKNLEKFTLAGNFAKNDADINVGSAMATGEMVPWKLYGITFKKNNVKLEVVETLNVHYNAAGSLVDCHVLGKLIIVSEISGTPKLTIGTNFSVGDVSYSGIWKHTANSFPALNSARSYAVFDHVKFHRSVALDSAYAGSICFTPPDTKFTLFTYRSTDKIIQPLRAKVLCHKRSSIRQDYSISIKWLLSKKLVATEMLVTLPIPPSSKTVDIYNVSFGNAKAEMSKSVVEWRIKKLCGEKELTMRCGIDFATSPISTQWKQLPLLIKFEIAGYAPSGISVNNLDSIDVGLKFHKSIRYLTVGNYQIYINC